MIDNRTMTRIREEVVIEAPPERVWEAVHLDLANAPRWSSNLRRAEALDGPPRKGSRVRYDLDLPGGYEASLTIRQSTWNPLRRCAGEFVGGPLKGTWSYSYKEVDGSTQLVYEMDYELGGLLRFAGGVLKGQYEDGIRRSMRQLKSYLEKGREQKKSGR